MNTEDFFHACLIVSLFAVAVWLYWIDMQVSKLKQMIRDDREAMDTELRNIAIAESAHYYGPIFEENKDVPSSR